jgi:hypothetical protein
MNLEQATYTGGYRKQLTQLLLNHGGIIELDITHIEGTVIDKVIVMLDEGVIKIVYDDILFPCFSKLITHLNNIGVGDNGMTNCNTEGGNSSDNVLGSWDIFGSLAFQGTPLIVELGVKTEDELFVNRFGPGSNSSSRVKCSVRQSTSPKSPKQPKISKADQRIMRPENGKAVWNNAYLKAKGIDHNAFIEKYGKEQVYADLKVMTVIEFETKYGLR